MSARVLVCLACGQRFVAVSRVSSRGCSPMCDAEIKRDLALADRITVARRRMPRPWSAEPHRIAAALDDVRKANERRLAAGRGTSRNTGDIES